MARATTAAMGLLTFRAFCGQRETQRIQEIHLPASVVPGVLGSIACTGHRFAHISLP